MNIRDYEYLEKIFMAVGILAFILIIFAFYLAAFEISIGSVAATLTLMFMTFLTGVYFRIKRLMMIDIMEREISRHKKDFEEADQDRKA